MIDIQQNVPLSGLNTMMTGGTARYLVEWDDADDLKAFFTAGKYDEVRRRGVKPVGQGSNLLFVSDRYEGALLKCRAKGWHKVVDSGDVVILKVDAGESLDDLVSYACRENLWGIENLSLIPGTVGAAAVQNVGAYGVEFKDAVVSVECFDRIEMTVRSLEVTALDYGYRHSLFKDDASRDRFIVTSVLVRLTRIAVPKLTYGNLADMVGDITDLSAIREAVISLRKAKLPDVGVVGSAGSFFKNPVVSDSEFEKIAALVADKGFDVGRMPVYEVHDGKKLSAAWLIDRAGWKGVTIGHAGVWPLQPLVLVNADGHASGRDMAELAAKIGEDVAAKFGVSLSTEVEYIY